MKMLFIKHFVIGFMDSEIPDSPYSGTVHIRLLAHINYLYILIINLYMNSKIIQVKCLKLIIVMITPY